MADSMPYVLIGGVPKRRDGEGRDGRDVGDGDGRDVGDGRERSIGTRERSP